MGAGGGVFSLREIWTQSLGEGAAPGSAEEGEQRRERGTRRGPPLPSFVPVEPQVSAGPGRYRYRGALSRGVIAISGRYRGAGAAAAVGARLCRGGPAGTELPEPRGAEVWAPAEGSGNLYFKHLPPIDRGACGRLG